MMHDSFTTATILSVFTEEIESRGGRITDRYDDGRRLFVRSLLPYVAEARPKDKLEGGIGLRATEFDVWLHPYLFREVCSNGAVMAHSIEELQLSKLELYSPDICVRLLREAIEDAAEPRVFQRSMEAVNSAMETGADRMLDMLAELEELRDSGLEDLIPEILQEFFAEEDNSRYALMNAVTATARDQRDPEVRWKLEELGGGVCAGLMPVQPSMTPGHQLPEPRAAWLA